MVDKPKFDNYDVVDKINANLDNIYGQLSWWRQRLGFDGNIPRIYYHGGDRIEELIARLRGELAFIADNLRDLTDEVKEIEEKFNQLIDYIDEKIAEDVNDEFDKRYEEMVNDVVERVKDFISDNLANQGVDWHDIGVMAYLPYKFRGYDAWIASSGQPYYAPGGLFIDDDYYYILHNPQSFDTSETIKNANNIVAIYDKKTLDTVAVIAVGRGTAESIYVETVDENRYLYTKASTTTWEMGKYDITNIADKAITGIPEIPVLKTFDIKLHMEFARFGNKWITEQVTIPRGRFNDRTMLTIWDDEFNTKQGQIHLDPTTMFYNRPLYNNHLAVKRQGLAVQNGQLIQVTGGLWRTNEEVTKYHMTGIQTIGADGKIDGDYTFSPEVIKNYLVSQGKQVDRIEAEGGVLYDNMVHTVYTYRTGNEMDDGIFIAQFQSPRRDFRGDGTKGVQTTVINRGYSGTSPYLPIDRDGHLFDTFTGAPILDMRSLMQYMSETSLDEVKFFTTMVKDMKEVDGVTPMDGATLVTVKNTNQSIFWVNYENYNDWYNRVVILDGNYKVTSNQIRMHLPNTAWQSVTLANGVTGAIDVRLAGYTMEVRLTEVRGLAQGKTLATLPSGYRPFAGNAWHTVVISEQAVATINVQDDGDIILGAVVGDLPSDGGIWATLVQTTYIQPK